MTSPVSKARQYQNRKRRKELAGVKAACWMRQFEGFTGYRGVYQDARSEWYFRSPRPITGKGRIRVYYQTLADALSRVNSRSEHDHNWKLQEVIKERGL